MVGALALGALTGCSEASGPARPLGATSSPAPVGAVDATAEALAEALRTGDAAAAERLAAPDAVEARARLRTLATNAGALGLRAVSVAYRPTADALTGSWEVRWRARSRDGGGEATVPVALAMVEGRAAVAELPDTPTQVWWLSTPLRVTSGPGWEVHTTGGVPPGLVRATRRARAAVARVLGDAPALVVEAPPDATTYDALLGGSPGEFAALAAVTTTVDGSARADAALRIVVNPDQRARMDPTGLAVVLAHEAAHVTVRDVVAPQPRWLGEGFADLVALRGLRLPGRTESVVAQVRRDGVPEALPAAADFAGRGAALEAAYEASWLACVILERRLGLAGLVSLRRSLVREPEPFAAALAGAGWSQRRLVEQWHARLSALAATPAA